MAGEPVKKIWSNGRVSNAVAMGASPSITVTSLALNTSRIILLMIAEAWGVISEGLIMTVFPAEIAEISGPKLKLTG